MACTRAYLLGLINGILFPDSSDVVNLRFLPFLVDLTEPTRHAWGASVLAYLYSCMTDFVQFVDANETKTNLNGCATLIQVCIKFYLIPFALKICALISYARIF